VTSSRRPSSTRSANSPEAWSGDQIEVVAVVFTYKQVRPKNLINV